MFGKRLKELRLKNNITQFELAESLNLSPSTIGMYEQERREPDIETFVRLARHFDVSTDYLTGASDNMYSEEVMSVITKKGGIYFRFAEKACNLDLTEEDLKLMFELYAAHKK